MRRQPPWSGSTPGRIPRVALYTRSGCHLCEEAREVMDRVRRDLPFALEVIDVDATETLRARYGPEVPVIEIDGRKHAKYRLDEPGFRRRLQGGLPRTRLKNEEEAP